MPPMRVISDHECAKVETLLTIFNQPNFFRSLWCSTLMRIDLDDLVESLKDGRDALWPSIEFVVEFHR